MSREIKFRVWDNNKMNYDPIVWGSHGLGECWINGYIKDKQNEGTIFMQYTGLHDGTKWESLTEEERAEWTRAGNKPSEWRGKEVYEGDICRFYECKEEKVFFHGLAYVDNKKVGGQWKIIKCNNEGGIKWGLDSSSFWNEDYEVIGDIYSTPELMEAKQ